MKQAAILSHKLPRRQQKELTLRQRQAASLLAAGHTIQQTADQVAVSEKAIDNWKKRLDFMDVVRDAEDDIYEESLRLLKRVAKQSILTLVSCMSEKYSAYVRVQAAAKLLEIGLEVTKHDVV